MTLASTVRSNCTYVQANTHETQRAHNNPLNMANSGIKRNHNLFKFDL